MEITKLKEIRLALKLSQKEFAAKIGIQQSYYSALELGKKDITTSKVLQLLFDNIGVRPEWFYNSKGAIFDSSNSDNERGSSGVNDTKNAMIDIGELGLSKATIESYKRKARNRMIKLLSDNESAEQFEKQQVTADKILKDMALNNIKYKRFRESIIKIQGFGNLLDNLIYSDKINNLIKNDAAAREYLEMPFNALKSALVADFEVFKPYISIFNELAGAIEIFVDKLKAMPTEITGIDKEEMEEYQALTS